MCSVQCTVYSVQCTVYSVHSTLYSLQWLVYGVQFTVYSISYTVYTVQHELPVYILAEWKKQWLAFPNASHFQSQMSHSLVFRGTLNIIKGFGCNWCSCYWCFDWNCWFKNFSWVRACHRWPKLFLKKGWGQFQCILIF